jgi:hypothetical protein
LLLLVAGYVTVTSQISGTYPLRTTDGIFWIKIFDIFQPLQAILDTTVTIIIIIIVVVVVVE